MPNCRHYHVPKVLLDLSSSEPINPGNQLVTRLNCSMFTRCSSWIVTKDPDLDPDLGTVFQPCAVLVLVSWCEPDLSRYSGWTMELASVLRDCWRTSPIVFCSLVGTDCVETGPGWTFSSDFKCQQKHYLVLGGGDGCGLWTSCPCQQNLGLVYLLPCFSLNVLSLEKITGLPNGKVFQGE